MEVCLMSVVLKRIINKPGNFYTLAENSRDIFWIRSACAHNQLLYITPVCEKIWERNFVLKSLMTKVNFLLRKYAMYFGGC